MGYIAQRSGDFQAASQYLGQAADLGGEGSETRRQRAGGALFYDQLLRRSRPINEATLARLALSAPLAQQSRDMNSAAKLFRADVLRHNKTCPRPNKRRALLNEQPQNGPAQNLLRSA